MTISKFISKLKMFSPIDYIFNKSRIHIMQGGIFKRNKDAYIKHSQITVFGKGKLTIGKYVKLENVFIYIEKGELFIDDYTIIKGDSQEICAILVDNGNVHISHHSLIAAKRIWVRYGGELKIGAYTNINANSEIRCDEAIFIGNYCQISYQVRIWDTNTHHIYPSNERKEIAHNFYPNIGKDNIKPKTKPIMIGDECWLGEKSAILKGTIIENNVNIGFNTIVSGKKNPNFSTVVTDIKLKIHKKDVN